MNIQNYSFFIRKLLELSRRRFSTKIKLPFIPNPTQQLNITICGASSKIGRVSAMLFKQEKIFENIILWDETVNMREAAVSDLATICKSPKIRTLCGRKALEEAVIDSKIIYICNNIQTTPGLTPLEIFKCNANAVRQIILYASEFNQEAMVVIASPPITSLVPLAYEEFRKNDHLADNHLFGVARIYLSRANSVAFSVCDEMTFDHKVCVVGGCDKDTCVPVCSTSASSKSGNKQKTSDTTHTANECSTVQDIITTLFEECEECALKTKVSDCNVDGCYLSMAASGFLFTLNLAKAIKGEKNITDYAFVKQRNPENFNKRYLTCKVHLKENGIASCEIPALSAKEEKHLKGIESKLNDYIHAGEVYITGRDQLPVHRPKIIIPEKPRIEVVVKPEIKEDDFCKPRPKPKSMVICGKK